LYLVPTVVAGIALTLFALSSFAGIWEPALRLNPGPKVAEPYMMLMGLVMFIALLMGVFYSLEALHGERRDRSILFWKSLPVSDLTTVLAKASIPMLWLPLFSYVLGIAIQFLALLWGSLVVAVHGDSVALLWQNVGWFHGAVMLLYHLITVHVLWYAPFYGYLFYISARVRHAAILWAATPLLAIVGLERMIFGTRYFLDLLKDRFQGGAEGANYMGLDSTPGAMTHITPGWFLISPGLWIGLAITALFLWGAARSRRERGPL